MMLNLHQVDTRGRFVNLISLFSVGVINRLCVGSLDPHKPTSQERPTYKSAPQRIRIIPQCKSFRAIYTRRCKARKGGGAQSSCFHTTY